MAKDNKRIRKTRTEIYFTDDAGSKILLDLFFRIWDAVEVIREIFVV